MLEVDVTPHSTICGDHVFSYCNVWCDGGAVSFLRVRTRNVERGAIDGNFEEEVQKRAQNCLR